jgi:hypothetical protein
MLDEWMRSTGDPRALSNTDPWSSYQYFGGSAPWPAP